MKAADKTEVRLRTVKYTYTVTNTGDTPLLKADDRRQSAPGGVQSPVTRTPTTPLQTTVGETWIYECTTTLDKTTTNTGGRHRRESPGHRRSTIRPATVTVFAGHQDREGRVIIWLPGP